MSRKKVATTVYVRVDQDRTLRLLAEKADVSVAQLIREGIDLVTEKHKNVLPTQGMLFDEALERRVRGNPATALGFE